MATFAVMKLKEWRLTRNMTLAEAAATLGMPGKNPSRTYQRYESGEKRPDAPLVEAIIAMTGGAVTVEDMHRARLDWLAARDGAVAEAAE